MAGGLTRQLQDRPPTEEELEQALRDIQFDPDGPQPFLELGCDCGARPAGARCSSTDAQLFTQLWIDRHPAPEHHATWHYALPSKGETPIKE